MATYGQIAALAGSPRAAITVGQILHRQTETVDLPWQRVINSRGLISTTCLEHPPELQAALLRGEGIKLDNSNGCYRINLGRYLWEPENRTIDI